MTPISEAEAMVMEVLWRSSPRSAEDVIAALSDLWEPEEYDVIPAYMERAERWAAQ